MSPTDKPVVLITGAARGIGLAAAERFLSEGWRVAMLDRLSDTLGQAHAALGSNDAIRIDADVSIPADAARAMEETEAAFGRLDALVNNAGIADFGEIGDTTFESWREIMGVNLDGPFLMSQAAVPLIARQGGSIVNVTSISGVRASTLRTAYGTSKAALAHLTKQQATELGEQGVRVNAVAPGPVATAMSEKVHTDEIRRDYRNAIPLGRYGSEAELAAAIYWLASPDASYVTGQILAVDGGFEGAGVGLSTLRGEDAPQEAPNALESMAKEATASFERFMKEAQDGNPFQDAADLFGQTMETFLVGARREPSGLSLEGLTPEQRQLVEAFVKSLKDAK